ncbi:EF-hand calcium-binding domain-containing protein 6 [Manis javanica]|nr:EF-hand calcium-binding domain-containing protein 6 [Manis javanica]
MPMGGDQYALLTAKIGYKKEGMSYLDFATRFEDAKMNRPAMTPQTPILSKSNLDSFFTTAKECLRHFPCQLKESFPEFRNLCEQRPFSSDDAPQRLLS